MKEELDSFVDFFAQYFQNLFNEKSLRGKFYDKLYAKPIVIFLLKSNFLL